MAALLTSTPTGPRAPAALTASSQSSSELTSRWTYTAAGPMSAATARPASSRTSPSTILAPSRANRRASASPCPRAAPVTIATLPSSLPIVRLLARWAAPVGPARKLQNVDRLRNRAGRLRRFLRVAGLGPARDLVDVLGDRDGVVAEALVEPGDQGHVHRHRRRPIGRRDLGDEV